MITEGNSQQLEREGNDMGKVRTGLAVSLDGFISGPNDGPDAPMGEGGDLLLAWYSSGDTDYEMAGTGFVFKVSAATRDFLRETQEATGALVMGRRTFDLNNGWGGNHPLDVPVFVLEGDPPRVGLRGLAVHLRHRRSQKRRCTGQEGGRRQGCGCGRGEHRPAVHQGRALLDEIHIDLVPVLLGGGVSLFDHLGTGPIPLEVTRTIQGAGVTHLTYGVLK